MRGISTLRILSVFAVSASAVAKTNTPLPCAIGYFMFKPSSLSVLNVNSYIPVSSLIRYVNHSGLVNPISIPSSACALSDV